MRTFSVEIEETSKELTKAERVKFKDVSNAIKLDEATKEGRVKIAPAFYVVLSITNEKATPQNYNNYLVVDKSGAKYITGSLSFWNAFQDIAMDMEGEDYEIEAYRLPSKNYKGKDFLTCSLV